MIITQNKIKVVEIHYFHLDYYEEYFKNLFKYIRTQIEHVSVKGNLMATCEYKPAEKTFSILIYDLTLLQTTSSDLSQIIYQKKIIKIMKIGFIIFIMIQ